MFWRLVWWSVVGWWESGLECVGGGVNDIAMFGGGVGGGSGGVIVGLFDGGDRFMDIVGVVGDGCDVVLGGVCFGSVIGAEFEFLSGVVCCVFGCECVVVLSIVIVWVSVLLARVVCVAETALVTCARAIRLVFVGGFSCGSCFVSVSDFISDSDSDSDVVCVFCLVSCSGFDVGVSVSWCVGGCGCELGVGVGVIMVGSGSGFDSL